jgi:integrating conjugative element relaxase (TIGR03760 family)
MDRKTEGLPGHGLPILSPQELLGVRRELVNRIDELAATTAVHFQRYYLAALQRFARWVQQLPASEAHHHAHVGGLLDHALEVSVTALQIRLGYLLPPGGIPEDIARDRDRWTYAVFTGALLHDAGKPAVDQVVTLFDPTGREIGPWNPWSRDMPETPDATYYRTDFNRQREYRVHENAALLIAPRIIPSEGLAWLAEDRACFSQWLAYATGDTAHAGVLGEILSRADSHSVARSLGATSGPRAATGTVVPLWEKLVTALRHLIETRELPLNRNGAAGWRVADDLWMVSKRTVDAIRRHLGQTGHQGIPTQNDRLFDILQEHGILAPCSDRAIWRAEVRGQGFAHTLTLLRIPAARMWADPEKWPEAFAGEIVVPDTNPDPAITSAQQAPNLVNVVDQPQEGEADTGCDIAPDNDEDTEPPASAEPSPNHKITSRTTPVPVDPFLAWLTEGLAAKRIGCNNPGARVHVVPDGVLLLSPAIFMDYVSESALDESWEKVQKRFLKKGLHVRTAKDLNIHRYRISGAHRQGHVTGLLIREPGSIFPDKVPKLNPHLVSDEQPTTMAVA